MNKGLCKFLVVTLLAVGSFLLSACDTLWKIQETTDISFTVDVKELLGILPSTASSFSMLANTEGVIDSNFAIVVTATLYDANDKSIIETQTASQENINSTSNINILKDFAFSFDEISVGRNISATIEIKQVLSYDGSANPKETILWEAFSKNIIVQSGTNALIFQIPAKPSITTPTVAFDKNDSTPIEINYDLGKGDWIATGITSVKIGELALEHTAIDGKITIDEKELSDLATGEHTITVIFNDSAKTIDTVKVTTTNTAPIKPSVTTTLTFDKDKSASIVLDYNLGNGSIAATGIASIKIGEDALEHTATGGKITINASELSALSVEEHIITVIFNDSAKTTIEVKLTIIDSEFIAPSVTQETAIFNKHVPASIDLDYNLGKGAIAATGITSVKIDEVALTDTATGGKITITTDVLFNLDLSVGEHIITVIFNDSAKTIDTVALTVNDSESIAPSVTQTTAEFDKHEPASIELEYNFGKGSRKADEITSIKIGENDLNYSRGDKKITIKDTELTAKLKDLARDKSHTITIIFNDAATTTIAVTLTVTDSESKLPSVTQEPAEFDKGDPADIELEYNLGKGDAGATGLTSVKLNEIDVEHTLVGEKIIISAAELSSKLEASAVGKHTITIIFNNTAATTIKVELTVTNTTLRGPSITSTGVTFDKNSANPVIEIEYDLGYGNLAATEVTKLHVGRIPGLLSGLYIPITAFTLEDGKITTKKDELSGVLKILPVGEYDITVTFNDSNSTTDTVKLTVTDTSDSEAPSVTLSTAEFDLAGTTDIEIAYDIGHGNLAATDIVSVQIRNDSSMINLDYTYDKVAGGKIIISADELSTKLSGLDVDKYTLTVTFDNDATDKAELTVIDSGPVAPSITSPSVSIDKKGATVIEIGYDFGSGNLGATAVTLVKVENIDGIPDGLEIPAIAYTVDEGKITTNPIGLASMLNFLPVGKYDIIVTFNDSNSTTHTVKLTVTDTSTPEAPSVTPPTATFNKSASTPIEIKYDIGHGTDAAKDIASVQITNSSPTINLAYTYDKFAGGKIIISADELSTKLSDLGADSYTITVTFNNSKTDTVTLEVTN